MGILCSYRRKDFQDVMDQIKVFSIEAQPIIELAARIYIEILDEVRQANYTLHERVLWIRGKGKVVS